MMNPVALLMSSIAVLVLCSGCSFPSDESGTYGTSMSAEYPSISISADGWGAVRIKGGAPPYALQSIGDSSVISATVYKRYYTTGTRIEINGRGILGSSNIIVRDSLGHTVAVTVITEAFSAFPQTIHLYPSQYTFFRVQGGKEPFTITNVSDSCAQVGRGSNVGMFDVSALHAGSSVVTVSDASVPPNVRHVSITVGTRGPFASGSISFSSNLGEVAMEGTLDPWKAFTSAGAGASGEKDWLGTFEQAFIWGFKPLPNGTKQIIKVDCFSWSSLVAGTTNIYDPQLIIMRPSPPQVFNCTFYHGTASRMEYDTGLYALTKGIAEIVEVGKGRIRGVFSGTGYRQTGFQTLDTTKPFTIWNGTFDVPYTCELFPDRPGTPSMIAMPVPDPLLDRYRDALSVRRQGERLRVGR